MRSVWWLAAVAAAVSSGLGCEAQPKDRSHAAGHPNQRYDFEDVKRRVGRLQRGDSAMEVMAALGSPARIERDRWLYLPSRSGLLLPAEMLEVRFLNGVYVAHTFKPIILGEPF